MESKPVTHVALSHVGLVLLLSLGMLTCGTTASIPEPTTDLPDGYHYAETEPDEQGWIATLQVRVESGEIVGVTYDEVQREGYELQARKSQDREYGELWAAATGGVNQFLVYSAIEQEFQRTATPDISAISGATVTVEKMQKLANLVLEDGGAKVSLNDGWHRVELQPDENGYHSTLEAQVVAGRLLQVRYNGVHAQSLAHLDRVSSEDTSRSAHQIIEARLRATADAAALAGIPDAPRSVENARTLSSALFEP